MHFNGLTTILSSSSMITPEYRFIYKKKQDKFDAQVMYPNIDIKYYHWTKNSNEKHNKSMSTMSSIWPRTRAGSWNRKVAAVQMALL